MMINDDAVNSILLCKFRTHQIIHNNLAIKTEYLILHEEILDRRKQIFLCRLKNQYDDKQIAKGLEVGFGHHFLENTILVNPVLSSDKFHISLHALEIKSESKSLIPIQISSKGNCTKIDKVRLALRCLIISQETHLTFDFGRILFGSDLRATRISLSKYYRDARILLADLIELEKCDQAPTLHKNGFCEICEYQKTCKEELINRDDLSLLGRIGSKEIEKQNSKGIFTVHQLSYTYKPRKMRRNANNNRYLWALKALALREKKTYIVEIPKFLYSDTEIFLDIEGLPDENFYYLIGLIIDHNGHKERLSFWADERQDERKIFEMLSQTLDRFDEFIIYHYGNYDIQALKKANKRYEGVFDNGMDRILGCSVNILKTLYTKVYPPVYGNGLKEIASYLGFQWSSLVASGIQSVVWRKKWELILSEEYKAELIEYNIDDCLALKLVKSWLAAISINNGCSENTFHVDSIERDNPYKFGDTQYEVKEFETIAKYAYFDYQREKIYLRDNKQYQKRKAKSRRKLQSISNKINTSDCVPYPSECPSCGNNRFYVHLRSKFLKKDLKFTVGGIKRWVTRYERRRFRCTECREAFTPKRYKFISKYGRNLKVWCVNHFITYRVSAQSIKNILIDTFQLDIPEKIIYRFKAQFAKEYQSAFEEIQQNIVNGHLIHADETRVSIKGLTGYVWVFTNFDSVFYIYKPTREAGFLKTLLNDFDGILVSDFYPGYDSLPCKHQKCLIHLIRDLNDDLLANQFDVEYRGIASNFGILLGKIVSTVDKYGLKNRHLRKHKKDVDRFYKKYIHQDFDSKIADKYKKRFEKYRESLFTFLSCNNVPWNNNNAEHAIKAFAAYRRTRDGLFSESSITEYLNLLSIQQTCKYRGLSFLEFLKSSKPSLDEYSESFL